MNVMGQKFQSLCELAGKPLAWRNHRGTLPQSRPLGVPAPSEREPGGVRTIQCAAQKPQRCGRFSSPLRKAFSIHRGTLPQSRVRSTAPSEREPGGAGTIQRAARKAGDCGRFSSPLRKLRIFNRPKTSGFCRGSDTGWGRALTVWEPSQSVIKKERKCNYD